MAFEMVAGETRQMTCRTRTQFQEGDEAERLMNPEKSKSTLINLVPSPLPPSPQKEETNISRPIDFEINFLPLSQGGGGKSKGQKKSEFLNIYHTHTQCDFSRGCSPDKHVAPRDEIQRRQAPLPEPPALELIPILPPGTSA